MTPEWKESQRPGFEAYARQNYYWGDAEFVQDSRIVFPHYYVGMTFLAFNFWLAAKADQVEVTDEMVERGQCAWRNYPLPVSVGWVHALEELEETDREMMRAALSAALNPPSPQGTEGEK